MSEFFTWGNYTIGVPTIKGIVMGLCIAILVMFFIWNYLLVFIAAFYLGALIVGYGIAITYLTEIIEEFNKNE